jgi:ATP-dependent DNA helicase Rep
VKDIMAYLRLILNENDDNAFLRIANVPRRKLGASTLEALGTFANARHCSLSQACGLIGSDCIAEAGLRRLREFRSWMAAISSQCQGEGGVAGIRQMIREMDYEDWLLQLSSSEDVARRRMANVHLLVDSLQRVMSSEQLPLDEAISRLVLRDLLEQQEEEQAGPDSVQLMTLHAAKGLEFPHVYIIGMEENLLPHRVSVEEDNIAEERRLAYVGITRARQTLTMSLAMKRRQFGETVTCEPSRFIAELPADDLQWQGGDADTAGANEQRGKETLAGLKNLLG